MRTPVFLALSATLALTACGGGSGGTSSGGNAPIPNPTSGGGLSSQAQAETAITVANSLGDPVKNVTNFNNAVSGASAVMRGGQVIAMTGGAGECTNGIEFFAPDKNNDPNSTEAQYFYDSGCTELARDIVRIFAVNGTSETVNRTEKQYAIDNSSPTAQRTSTVAFINGSYNVDGFPNVAHGFDRSATSELDISGAKTLLNDDELVMLAGSNGVNAYCSDTAGYNATGIPSLNETFGSEGGTSSGTRTVNTDGSVTWQSTNSGTAYKGAIGSFAINIGSANTACPIAAPEYTLSGGTPVGTYSVPVSATFSRGLLTNLTVTNAQLANGNTLNVSTNGGVQPQNSQFITGTIGNNGTQIATFAVDAFGDGTLTVTRSGAQYVMSDWHVVK